MIARRPVQCTAQFTAGGVSVCRIWAVVCRCIEEVAGTGQQQDLQQQQQCWVACYKAGYMKDCWRLARLHRVVGGGGAVSPIR